MKDGKGYRIALVTVPQSDPTQMHVAVPNLVAFMRAEGYGGTTGHDCNIGAYSYFLRGDRLQLATECIRNRILALDEKNELTPQEAKQLCKLLRGLALSEVVVDGIEGALETVRTPARFYDFDAYWKSMSLIEDALQVVSAEFSLWDWSTFNCESPGSRSELASLVATSKDFENNPFVEYYRKEFLPWLTEHPCDLLGISMVYTSQLIPGLALAALAKEQTPHLRVVAGGNAISRVSEALTGTDSWFPFLDFVVYSEGEQALLQLARALESGSEHFGAVPNLRFYSESEHRVIETPLHIEDLNSHPTPDFSDFPIRNYLSPTPVITLDVTRGCYWGKCAFCSYGVSEKILKAYRERTLDRIIEDMRTIEKTYEANNFLLSVDVLSPSFVRKLSRRLLDESLLIRWMGDLRLERAVDDELSVLMHSSGCRFISSGLESASQRVQNWMGKGTDQSHAGRILKGYRRAGIGVNIQFFLGFPTETREEAHVTLDFVKSHSDVINTIGFGHFKMVAGAAVEKNPQRFGVNAIERGAQGNLSLRFPYKPETGLTSQEAEELIKAEIAELRKLYPVCSNMSLLIGAHGLLHLAHFGPDEFNARLRAYTCRPPQEVRRPEPVRPLTADSRIGLAPGTALLGLRHDLYGIVNSLMSSGSGDASEALTTTAVPPDAAKVCFLYQAKLDRICRLSPEQAELVFCLDQSIPFAALIARNRSLPPIRVTSIVRAMQRAGFVSVDTPTGPTP